MIIASFKQSKDKKWVSYEITGHANFSHHGQDIVCAAVSALAITTANNIERLAHYQPIFEIDNDNGGYLYIEVISDLTQNQKDITQLLIEQLYLSLKHDIVMEYPDFVSVEIV